MSLVVVEVVGVSGLVVGDSWLRSSPALLSPLACVGGVEQPGKLSLSLQSPPYNQCRPARSSLLCQSDTSFASNPPITHCIT